MSVYVAGRWYAQIAVVVRSFNINPAGSAAFATTNAKRSTISLASDRRRDDHEGGPVLWRSFERRYEKFVGMPSGDT
jgi:hypothetical protein